MDTIPTPNDFKEFLKLLNERTVKYLVVGGYAVGYHGYPRPTGDLDIWVSNDRENVRAVISLLAEFGFESSDDIEDRMVKRNTVLRMGFPPVRIEVMTHCSGVDFEDCYRRRIKALFDDVEVSLIDRPDLLINKKASGRLKDLNDLENLPA
jgi:hypothetical protein